MTQTLQRLRSQQFGMERVWAVLVAVLGVCLFALVAQAQTSSPPPGGSILTSDASSARMAQLERDVADAKSSGDNAWMLMSSALVLMMTGPGLALFYGGLVRKKNVLSTMMQSFAMMAIVTLLWSPIVSRSLPETASSAACTTSSCAEWEHVPTLTTPPPSRCRLS